MGLGLGRRGLIVSLVFEIARLFGAAGQAGPAAGQLQPGSLVIVSHLSGAALQGGFGEPAAEINKAYAERHGYRLELVRGDGHAADRDARWSKVMILRNLLEADAGDGDATFVLWMDSDAVFTNFDFSALGVAQRMITEGAHVAVCKDLSVPRETSRQTCGPICLATGTILLRNSEWTRALLRAWCEFSKVLHHDLQRWEAGDNDEFAAFRHGRDHEETVLARLYATDVLQMRKKIMVELNSVPPFYRDHDAAQPVMHLSATPDAVRAVVMQRLASLRLASVSAADKGVVYLDVEAICSNRSTPTVLHSLTTQAYRDLWEKGTTDSRVPTALAAAAHEDGDDESALQLLEAAVGLAADDVDGMMAYGSLLAASAQAGLELEWRWCDAARVFLRASRLMPSSQQTGSMLRNANSRCAQAKRAMHSRDQAKLITRYSILFMAALGALLVAYRSWSRPSRPAQEDMPQHRKKRK